MLFIYSLLDYSKCIIDFKKCMISHIKKEESKAIYTDKNSIAKIFLNSLLKFIHHLGIDPILIDNEIKNDIIEFSYISFNYTMVFDTCLDILKQENIFQLEKKIKKGFFNFTKFNDLGTVEHIHGTLENNMIVGVNDLKQIKNTSFHKIDKIDSYIKPNSNDKLENNRNLNVIKMINNADIYCIFGMSLGKTDKKWWIEIAQQMYKFPNKKLVIYAYDNNYNGAIIENTLEIIDYYKILFLNHLKFTNLDKDGIKNLIKQNIHVVINTDIFKIKLT